MYRVSYKYLVSESNNWRALGNLGHKSFRSEQEAIEWAFAEKKAGRIVPLKLLAWNDTIDCFSTIRVFN